MSSFWWFKLIGSSLQKSWHKDVSTVFIRLGSAYLENELPADVDGVIQIGKEIGEDEGGHVAHDDLAELLLDVQRRTDFVGRLVDDVSQGDDVGGEVAVGSFVDHLDDRVDVLDAVLVRDDVERDRDRAVDQDPLQSLDVSGMEN